VAGLTFISLFLFKGSLSHQLDVIRSNWVQLQEHFYDQDLTHWDFHASPILDFLVVFHVKITKEILSLYTLCAIAALIIICVVLFFLETILWKKFAALAVASLILPQISIDYHMLRIYLPLYLFVNDKDYRPHQKMDLIYTLIFGLLLIPKNYFSIAGYSAAHWLETGLLLLLLSLIISENISIGWKGLKKRNGN